MPADPPSPSELVREVQRLVRQIEDLVREVRNDYVRKDVYEVNRASLLRTVEELERDVEKRENDRKGFQRQILGGAIVGLLLLLANIVVSVLRTVPGAGV